MPPGLQFRLATGGRRRWTPVTEQSTTAPSVSAHFPGIRATGLAGVFSKHPYDGTPRTYFPRVAGTVTDWSRNACWIGTATIWWSKSKSEPVPAFSVCWGQSVGYAVNNAANLHADVGHWSPRFALNWHS